MKGYFEKMKKFVLAFGIPVLAVASLIGSGYATWYFNNTVDPANKDIAVEPTEKRVVGAKFQHSEGDIKLVLDQPTKEDGMPAGRLGVHFEGTFKESLIANDGNDTTLDDKFVNGTSYKVTTTITIPSEVAEYVDFTYNKTTSSATSLTLKKETTLEVVDETKSSFDVFDITEVTVEYTAKEPSASAEYDTMKTAVSGKTIDIKFEAEIVK